LLALSVVSFAELRITNQPPFLRRNQKISTVYFAIFGGLFGSMVVGAIIGAGPWAEGRVRVVFLKYYKNTHPTVNTLHFLDLLLGEAANDDLREQVS
jgi:hypothetical protein